MSDKEETRPESPKFDFSAYPADSLFLDRREKFDRRDRPPPPTVEPTLEDAPKARPERRARKERRKRVDPTTFEKQYTGEEMEFLTAVQQFKTRTGKSFPSYGDVLRVAAALGYRKNVWIDELDDEDVPSDEIEAALPL